VGVLMVAGALVAVLATSPSSTYTEVQTPLLGKPAPAVSGTTLSGGHFALSSLRGRWVFVNFFASWCPPCQQEEPDLVAFAYQHRKAGDAALVSVVYSDTVSNARAFLAQAGATWPAVVDPGGQIALDYGVRDPPETFLISPGGVVLVHLDGAVTDAGLDYWLGQARRGET
jgi:cytochrome c biogenesis protein CcmG, thiol:disulfide interchange protein DsbE